MLKNKLIFIETYYLDHESISFFHQTCRYHLALDFPGKKKIYY